jgi:protein PhnA
MSIESTLLERCHSKCELCSAGMALTVYHLPPVAEPSAEKSVMLCGECLGQIQDSSKIDANHWRCLGESMWSEHPAVQVMAWRFLKRLSGQDWAQDLLNQLYLGEDIQKWAEAATDDHAPDPASGAAPTKDSNGNVLMDGDSVTLIKDLDVKGANFTAKRGTVVKNISLTSNPEHIEGRVNGTQIVLLTRFLKKMN